MDNALIKKDNLIFGLWNKLDKNNEYERYSQYYEREIIIIEPSAAVTQMHDELLLCKQIYDNLATHIREKRDSISRYEAMIHDLQNENGNLRTQIKLQALSVSRKNKENKENKHNTRSTSTDTDLNSRKQGVTTTNGKNIKLPVCISKLKDKLRIEDDINPEIESSNMNKSFNHSEEWNEIMRLSGLTSEEMDKLARNKMLIRNIEAFEMLKRLLCDKNLQISVLQKENDNLNNKNFDWIKKTFHFSSSF